MRQEMMDSCNDINARFTAKVFFFSVHAEIQQFHKGLNSISGFGDLVMNNPGIFKTVLGAGNQKLSAQSFKKFYSIVYSGKGSNDRDKEDKKIYCLDLYLQDLEEEEVNGVTLEDLLVFTTGADTVPPLAFDGPILIEFYETEENVKRYPWSSTNAP
ncbi:uncharacterized protein [Acropora muricata]|uniref:uncharacterized protein n=1 Tax=Acropora muricata TaxID=159855 RepID=UPI0034E5ACC2